MFGIALCPTTVKWCGSHIAFCIITEKRNKRARAEYLTMYRGNDEEYVVGFMELMQCITQEPTNI